MKKILTVIMLFSFFTSLFASFGSKAQDAATAAKTAAATTTITTTATTPATATTAATTVTKTEVTPAAADANAASNPLENTLYLDLKDGRVVIQLLPEVAPKTVARIKELVRQKFYDNVVFHRVIDGFMAQTGDPTGTGTGGSGQKLDAEFNSEKHVRGTVSMARAADPNSADSQFFIVFQEAPHLDGNYTVFGKVTEGMEFVDKIKKGNGPNGMVSDPDKIIKLRVAADEKGADVTAPAAATTAPAATTTIATPAATTTTTVVTTPAADATKPAEAPKQ